MTLTPGSAFHRWGGGRERTSSRRLSTRPPWTRGPTTRGWGTEL